MLSLTYAQDSVYTVFDLDQYQNLKNPFVYNLVNALYQRAQTNDPNLKKKYLIQNFCDAILTDIVGEGFQYDQVFIINPRQSFFLYHLCRGVDPKYHDFFPILHPLVINQSSRDLPLKLKPQDVCHSTQANLGDCKISDIVTPLIKIVRDDLYRIKYASIQLYQGPAIPPEDFIKSYARRFLTTDLPELSQGGYCNNLSYHYIYPESLSDHKSWFCSHPKVFKELTTISKGMSKLVKKNVIIDGVSEDMYLSDSYSDNPAESDYAKLCNIYIYPNAPDTTLRKRNTKYDMVRCAFTLNHQNANIGLQEHQKAQGSMQAFYNLEYNEILMYRLFVSYYQLVAQTNNQFGSSIAQTFGSYSDISKHVSEELDVLADDVRALVQEQDRLHALLGDLSMAFNLHVAHRIYQEDVSVFNKTYAIVITQVSQLRNKLYKAQEMTRK